MAPNTSDGKKTSLDNPTFSWRVKIRIWKTQSSEATVRPDANIEKQNQYYLWMCCREMQFKSQLELQSNQLEGHLKVRQTESLCFLSLSEGVSGQTADIPAVRWVESLREPGKCLSHTQALNLTHFNRAAAISHRELNADIHASRVMTTVFTGCHVMLYQHYLFVLMPPSVSQECFFHQLVAGVWHSLTPCQENENNNLQERYHLLKYGLHPFHLLLTLCWGNVCNCVAQSKNYVSHLDLELMWSCLYSSCEKSPELENMYVSWITVCSTVYFHK